MTRNTGAEQLKYPWSLFDKKTFCAGCCNVFHGSEPAQIWSIPRSEVRTDCRWLRQRSMIGLL
jgi:hypothetical protein